ncbi:hypothetical protein X943_000690 [Babesia divergens]|uniref:Uncharacterized protein n=1 Tax=Babesia divergens TaxID=32595 RepID=A0AAD9LGT3_BABDI|nr:hypothetical protein X943_000690 [Babesia divergens]
MKRYSIVQPVAHLLRPCRNRYRLAELPPTRGIRYGSTTATIRAADNLSVYNSSPGKPKEAHIVSRLGDIRGSTLSIQDACAVLKTCLEVGHFDHELLSDCLSVVEGGYFSPVLVGGSEADAPLLFSADASPFKSCFDAINGLSVREKASMWQDKLSRIRRKCISHVEQLQPHVTADIDPEGRELFTTKKLGKVLDPKPLRVRVRQMAPGRKLCNTLALQLREAIPSATLMDLGNICTIFAVRLPLSGQMNDDTMDMLAARLHSFSPEDLASVMHHIAFLCSAAATRAVETWSYNRASGSARSSESHRLYSIRRLKLPQPFLQKVANAVGVYTNGEVCPEALGFCLGRELKPLEQHVHTAMLLARSDVPLSIQLWNALLSNVDKHLHEGIAVDTQTVLCFFEAVDYAQYTTPQTINTAQRLLSSCKYDNTANVDIFEGKHLAILQMLRLISTYSLGTYAKELLDILSEWMLQERTSLSKNIRLVH